VSQQETKKIAVPPSLSVSVGLPVETSNVIFSLMSRALLTFCKTMFEFLMLAVLFVLACTNFAKNGGIFRLFVLLASVKQRRFQDISHS
jgi:hypothetical protein